MRALEIGGRNGKDGGEGEAVLYVEAANEDKRNERH